MSKKTAINGKINNSQIKVIIKGDDKKQIFAKPKDKDISVPHFTEYKGMIDIHEDSSDNLKYRTMTVNSLASSTVTAGEHFAEYNGWDYVLLPTEKSGEGFSIVFNEYKAIINMPKTANALIAFGKWNDWKKKR